MRNSSSDLFTLSLKFKRGKKGNYDSTIASKRIIINFMIYLVPNFFSSERLPHNDIY